MSYTENIILIGFMGTGKTAIAREISRILKFPHFETDKMIAEKEGMSIPEIFKQKGEEYFRQMETDLLRAMNEILKDKKAVVCTGGGMPITPVNRPLLKELGYVVWLKTSPEETLERVSVNNDRPLLQVADPMAKIQELMDERFPIYKEVSEFKINTGGLSISEIANGIIDSASYYFSQHSGE